MPLGVSNSPTGENSGLYSRPPTFLSNSGYSHGARSRASGLQGPLKSPLSSVAWLDVRVVYVRVSSCPLHDDVSPEALQFYFPPRSIGSELEINGARISPSEEVFLTLRRDRIDCDSAEATFVSTDNVRCNSSVEFEVVHSDESILSGSLVRTDCLSCISPEASPSSVEAEAYRDPDSSSSGIQESTSGSQTQSLKLGWSLECACTVGPNGCVFMKTKSNDLSATLLHPAIEVCIVGRFNGLPVILTQTIPLVMRRRMERPGGLDAIPELDEKDYSSFTPSETGSDVEDSQGIAVVRRSEAEDDPIRDLHEKADALFGGLYGNAAYGEDGEMSWFNAGVRVGVGLGLGMCLGLGIGVGLMIRTYQVTTRSFRRGFL